MSLDSLIPLLRYIGPALSVAGTAYSVSGHVNAYLQRRGRDRRLSEIRAFLEGLGTISAPDVRRLVDDQIQAGVLDIDEEQSELLIGVLMNLVQGARFLSTQGTLRSSYMRSAQWIDKLTTSIQVVKQRGQMAGLGEWRLESYLGHGSFGEVWKGINPTYGLDEPRAFKYFTTPEGREWILREQQSLIGLRRRLGEHPHVIQSHDIVIEQDHPFLVLEYVAGGSLEDWILEDPAARQPLNKHEVLRGILEGIRVAHEQCIAHRDLKPANVLLTGGHDPQPKVTDFGLAMVTDPTMGSEVGSQGSAVQELVGTRLYMPPESQLPWVDRDPLQDDVFAFGVLWYQLLVERIERPPYDFHDQLRDEVGVDAHTLQLLSRCLAAPDRRFKSASELGDRMDDVHPGDWTPPAGCYDVQHLFREYLGCLAD